MAVIVDSSAWVDFLIGKPAREVRKAMSDDIVVIPPLVIAELLAGQNSPAQLTAIGELLQEFSLHETPLAHWIDVGFLRRLLRANGINATIPDTHVAQCALDLDAILLTGDAIFTRIAIHTPLRLGQLR